MCDTKRENRRPYFIRDMSLSNCVSASHENKRCFALSKCLALRLFAKVHRYSPVRQEAGERILFLSRLMRHGKRPRYAPNILNQKNHLCSQKAVLKEDLRRLILFLKRR